MAAKADKNTKAALTKLYGKEKADKICNATKNKQKGKK
jgi:hypothetical protein